MARVRDIDPAELPVELADIYREFAGSYGPFRNQVAVFAMCPRRCATKFNYALQIEEEPEAVARLGAVAG